MYEMITKETKKIQKPRYDWQKRTYSFSSNKTVVMKM